MKKFSDWDWRIKILGPICYSLAISGFFAHEYVVQKTPMKLVGLVLIIVGYTFMLIARFQLKDKFSILPEVERGFATHGLYRFFRNPTYLFSSVAAVGIYFCVIANLLWWSPLVDFSIAGYLFLQYHRSRGRDHEFQISDCDYDNRPYMKYMKKTWF